MSTNGEVDVMEFYNKAFKSWADMWSSQGKAWAPGSEAFKAPSVETWFRPQWGYMDSWQKMGQGFAEMARGMRTPFESMKYSSEAVARGVNLYVKLYDAWFKASEKLARQGFEVGQQLSAGEKPDVARFMDSLKTAYDEVTRNVVESMKETPLAGVKEIDEAVRKALESFPEEQQAAREFLQQLFAFTIETVKTSTASMAEAVQSFSDLLEKGTISTDTYRDLIDGYGKTLKQSIEVLRPSAALFPGFAQVVDDAIGWAKSNLDVEACWLEMNLKLQKSMRDSYVAVSRSSQEAFAQAQAPSSPDEFFKKWSAIYEKSVSTFVEGSQLFATVPSFVQCYTNCLKAASNVYRSAMAIPFATKAEVERVETEIEKVKSQAEKAARTAAKSGKPA